MKKAFFLLLCLAAAVPSITQAQGFKDGPHFAYPTGGDVRNERAGFGWQVAYEWTEFFSVESSITRQTDRLDDLSLLPDPFNTAFDLEIVNIAVSGRLGYRYHRLNLYLAGGLGYYFMRADSSDVNQSIRDNAHALPAGVSEMRMGADLKNTFAYHAAIGAEWVFHNRWEAFAEYRRVQLDTDVTFRRTEIVRSGDTFSQSTTRSNESLDYDHGLIRVGVNYRF